MNTKIIEKLKGKKGTVSYKLEKLVCKAEVLLDKVENKLVETLKPTAYTELLARCEELEGSVKFQIEAKGELRAAMDELDAQYEKDIEELNAEINELKGNRDYMMEEYGAMKSKLASVTKKYILLTMALRGVASALEQAKAADEVPTEKTSADSE